MPARRRGADAHGHSERRNARPRRPDVRHSGRLSVPHRALRSPRGRGHGGPHRPIRNPATEAGPTGPSAGAARRAVTGTTRIVAASVWHLCRQPTAIVWVRPGPLNVEADGAPPSGIRGTSATAVHRLVGPVPACFRRPAVPASPRPAAARQSSTNAVDLVVATAAAAWATWWAAESWTGGRPRAMS